MLQPEYVSIEDLVERAAAYEASASKFPDHNARAAKLRAKAQEKREEAEYLAAMRGV